MAGADGYTPGFCSSLFTVALLITLSVYAWRRRRLCAAPLFALACLCATMWVAGSAASSAAVNLAGKIFWHKFEIAWQLPTLSALACFILEYTWPGRWRTRAGLFLLCAGPVLVLVLMLTNDLHHLMWLSLTEGEQLRPVRGAGNYVSIVYALGLGLIQVFALLWLFVRSPPHRLPAVIMLCATIANRVSYFLKVIEHPIAGYVPSDVLLVGIAAVSFGIALFGFRILDPIAQAHSMAVEQMNDGMLVLDHDGRVASMNPAARAILNMPSKGVLGHRLEDLLPTKPGIWSGPDRDGAERFEICLGAGRETRRVLAAASVLKDWRGLDSGRLLLLRDVTAERKAQAQIVEQQRSLATLAERDRLARELHDSLGQALAAAHLQAGTARLLLDQGKTAEADECLAGLAEMTLAAEVDVREYILGARLLSSGLPFFKALRRYIEHFDGHYGVRAELSVPPRYEGRDLEPAVAMQLLRIVQEALANVRKHAQASAVEVTISASGPFLRAVIADDGRGFDPAAEAGPGGGRFGLRTMCERAESLGGSVEVFSQPGQGARVVARVPVEEMKDDG